MNVLPSLFNLKFRGGSTSPNTPTKLDKLRHFWYAVDNAGVRNIGQRRGDKGVFSSGVVWTRATGGTYMRFNSSGTRVVSVGDNVGSGAPLNSVFTVMARVNMTDVANYQTFYGSADTSTVFVFRLNSSAQLEMVQPGVSLMASSTGTLTANKPYNIAVTYDGSTVRFYIDGKPAGSGSYSVSFNHNVQYYIGAEEATGTTRPFQDGGKIGYVAVWDKKMTDSEISFYSKNLESMFTQTPDILTDGAAPAATTYIKTQAFVSC